MNIHLLARFARSALSLRNSLRRFVMMAVSVVAVVSLLPTASAQAAYPEPNWLVVNGPPSGAETFGQYDAGYMYTLANGNIVVTDYLWDNGGTTNVGAVFLYDGDTMALISRLTGSTANDKVGAFIYRLGANTFLVQSNYWNGNRGAVTFIDGTTGLTGTVSSSNSAVGTTANDEISVVSYRLMSQNARNAALGDGGYLVGGSGWDGGAADVGAVRKCSASGCTGALNSTNSFVGVVASDLVGQYVYEMVDGAYLIFAPSANVNSVADSGAIVKCSAAGCTGTLSTSNSLYGTRASDAVGSGSVANANINSLGNALVASPDWDYSSSKTNVGAVTFISAGGAYSGPISATNSYVGANANDALGTLSGISLGGTKLAVLPNGNYILACTSCNYQYNVRQGALIRIDGAYGLTGVLSTATALMNLSGELLEAPQLFTLSQTSNYFVLSDRDVTMGGLTNRGALRWFDGSQPITGVGVFSSAQLSLLGNAANQRLGESGVKRMANGNYWVLTPGYDVGALTDAGALTWGSDSRPITGYAGITNSIVGSSASEKLGAMAEVYSNSMMLASPYWDNGVITDVGAVRLFPGDRATTGTLTAENSLIGAQTADRVGVRYHYPTGDPTQGVAGLQALANGNWVVASSHWDNGAIADAGAVTWIDGVRGLTGVVSVTNSLVGVSASDWIGGDPWSTYYSTIESLANGNYVVRSPSWDNGVITNVGALTWGDGSRGTTGTVNAGNSYIGTSADDRLGAQVVGKSPIVETPDGNILFSLWSWDDTVNSITNRGAVVYLSGYVPVTGQIRAGELNVIYGQGANSGGISQRKVYATSLTSRRRPLTAWETDHKIILFDLAMVSVTLPSGGRVTANDVGINCGLECERPVYYSQTVSLAAEKAAGVGFDSWDGACADAGTAPTCTLFITQTKYVTATYSPRSMDALLASLDNAPALAGVTFISTTQQYTTAVSGLLSMLTLTGTPNAGTSTVTYLVGGEPCTANACPLVSGDNYVTVRVTAEDGYTTQDYVILVNRPEISTDSTLRAITLSTGSLAPAFVTSTQGYTAEIPPGTNVLTVTPQVNNAGATYTMAVTGPDGVLVACPSNACPLATGVNTVTVRVTAEDASVREYTIVVNQPMSSDATFSGLDVSDGALTPAFVSSTTSYTMDVSYATYSLTLTPTVGYPLSTYTFTSSAGPCVGATLASPICPLTTGANVITATVVAEDGTTREYVIEVTKPASSDATMIGLTPSAGTLTPTFDKEVQEYTAEVTYTVRTLVLTPTLNDPAATYTMAVQNPDGTVSVCAANACPLATGVNLITTTVTAENGAVMEYVIAVTKAASSDATLSGLAPSTGVLSPAFAGGTTAYTMTLPNGTNVLTMTPTVNEGASIYTVTVQNPDGTVSVCALDACNLTTGVNTITVTVTAEDGTVTEYVIETTVLESSDATLSGLGMSAGVLSPAFDAGTTAYAATVRNDVSSLTLTPTVNDAGATYTMSVQGPDGTVSICAADACPLATGTNTITITITSEDGTVQEYVATVTRAIAGASSDASLGELGIAPGELTPAFVSTTTRYTASLPGDVTSLVVTATANDISATVTLVVQMPDGTVRACVGATLASPICPLDTGLNVITATVVAADGTVQEYVVEITRAASSDVTLSDLGVTPGTLLPIFDAETLEYTTRVTNAVSSVVVNAPASNANATVTYASSAGACTGADCPLNEGANTITVTVTAEDGTVREYVINVTRAAAGASSDATLADVVIDGADLAPPFAPGTTRYTTTLPAGTTALTLTTTISQAEQLTMVIVDDDGNETLCALATTASCPLQPGLNVITVTVMAEDGTVIEYVIEMTVPASQPEGLEIGGVWPNLGTPEGGMPATVLGSGFTGATQLLVGGVSVPFTVTGDGRIDFMTPPGVNGTTVDITIVTPGGSVTLANAFGYAAADVVEMDASVGGVVTTTNGVVIEVPAQGVSGTLRITVTPEAPPADQDGRLLLYSFRAEATLDGQPLGVITSALQMKLAVDAAYMKGGWLPWLWEWTTDDGRRTTADASLAVVVGRQSSVVSEWQQVPGQEYDAVKGEVRARVKTMTHYALTVRYGLKFWCAWLEQR